MLAAGRWDCDPAMEDEDAQVVDLDSLGRSEVLNIGAQCTYLAPPHTPSPPGI